MSSKLTLYLALIEVLVIFPAGYVGLGLLVLWRLRLKRGAVFVSGSALVERILALLLSVASLFAFLGLALQNWLLEAHFHHATLEYDRTMRPFYVALEPFTLGASFFFGYLGSCSPRDRIMRPLMVGVVVCAVVAGAVWAIGNHYYAILDHGQGG